MKVVYVFESANSAMILEKMIIPQLEEERHNAQPVGMFFFFDNTYLMVPENPIGEKLVRLANKYGFFILCCDMCCEQRGIMNSLYQGVEVGCFPDLYKLAEKVEAQQVITL